jgi:hypothetical protein
MNTCQHIDMKIPNFHSEGPFNSVPHSSACVGVQVRFRNTRRSLQGVRARHSAPSVPAHTPRKVPAGRRFRARGNTYLDMYVGMCVCVCVCVTCSQSCASQVPTSRKRPAVCVYMHVPRYRMLYVCTCMCLGIECCMCVHACASVLNAVCVYMHVPWY